MTESVEFAAVALQPLLFAPAPKPVTVLILARDEADVRPAPPHPPEPDGGDRLCVVADHCRDATVHIARHAGATVHVRRKGEGAGKGAALRWWLRRTALAAEDDEAIIILDADSRPGPGLIECLRGRLSRGEVAVQARLEPLLPEEGAVPRLAAFSETVEQGVFDVLRARWGWPVRLHGTGMAFTRATLALAAHRLSTTAEDAELTILLAAAGVPITLAMETCVIDPKPRDAGGAMRQRARWFRGQSQILRHHWRSALALLGRGPSGWALLSSVFLQPKSVFVPIKVCVAAGALAAWAVGLGWAWAAVGGLMLMSLAIDLAGLIAGLVLTPQRACVIRALVVWPAFLAIWLSSLALTLASRGGWERARPAVPAGVPLLDAQMRRRAAASSQRRGQA
jgi:cellulose synthase/poly-beta-1,6-N-acetylglucosamine synthase-like glycosyltransferase